MESNWLILLSSCPLHGAHSPQIQRQAHELELGLRTVKSSQAELTDPSTLLIGVIVLLVRNDTVVPEIPIEINDL